MRLYQKRLGIVTVLSAVGSVIAIVVSKEFAVAPSNTSGLAPANTAPVAVTIPVIVGAVNVGAVKVCISKCF